MFACGGRNRKILPTSSTWPPPTVRIGFGQGSEASELQKSDALYRSAQRAFQRQNYDEALALFEQYLKWGESHAHRRERVFWSLDRVGAIYLQNHVPI